MKKNKMNTLFTTGDVGPQGEDEKGQGHPGERSEFPRRPRGGRRVTEKQGDGVALSPILQLNLPFCLICLL